MTKLGQKENYISREITFDTVLGILNRLIGDQRKLYQAKEGLGGDKHYFEDISTGITYEDKPSIVNHEIAYIRNISGNTDRNSFTGMIKAQDPAFQSDFSPEFWGVLFLDFEQLCAFILDENIKIECAAEVNPICILNRFDEIKKMEYVSNTGNVKAASEKLASHFEKYDSKENKGKLKACPFYCSSLYLQLSRLRKSYDLSSVLSKNNSISGISKNNFTPKDFMERYTTGSKKLIYGNPYVREEFIKGEGKIKHTLKKVSGQLDIQLDIKLERAIELKNLIDCAGVSSFYLGKKGLAYVSRIDVR